MQQMGKGLGPMGTGKGQGAPAYYHMEGPRGQGNPTAGAWRAYRARYGPSLAGLCLADVSGVGQEGGEIQPGTPPSPDGGEMSGMISDDGMEMMPMGDDERLGIMSGTDDDGMGVGSRERGFSSKAVHCLAGVEKGNG